MILGLSMLLASYMPKETRMRAERGNVANVRGQDRCFRLLFERLAWGRGGVFAGFCW